MKFSQQLCSHIFPYGIILNLCCFILALQMVLNIRLSQYDEKISFSTWFIKKKVKGILLKIMLAYFLLLKNSVLLLNTK